ncbi:hypothetical protein [uncultured Sphingomonas sp.]|uniref:hypothetical protein n=1 Tax=uncultured Sphingomonas sp. TaxID=158754 RepID=UPI0035CAC343
MIILQDMGARAVGLDPAERSEKAGDHAVSLGDRSCMALAKRDGMPAWPGNRRWKQVADAAGVKVGAIR